MNTLRRAAAAVTAALTMLVGCSTGDDSPGREPNRPGPSAGHGPGERIRGITLPAWDADDYDRPEARRYLRQIKDTGARWVVFTPTWYQDGRRRAEIHTTGETVSDRGLRRIIGLAHADGLKVLLKPHVDLVGGGDRAGIRPADRDAWFAAYRRFITHYAALAEELEVEQFAVGTELAGTSGDRKRWSRVISAVRDRYRGRLTYAANFDEYPRVRFWDALDLIGIDAYWPLTERPTTDPAELAAGWRAVVAELAAFSARHHRKILFTEAGYVSQRGTATAPYSWTVSERAAEDEQSAAYQALLTAFDGEPWWAGVCWWMWDDWPDSGETPARLAYTPHGKPAEKVLRRWWRE
ncbi:glycoside hydrolase family 113 [Streptomyces sp. NPDC018031]|uniref:glycoside hydrolase family 113 n=1 Tax=Streptomyces sp. NPDC018031 TaxID=3365033 RepID=UPI0037AAC83D